MTVIQVHRLSVSKPATRGAVGCLALVAVALFSVGCSSSAEPQPGKDSPGKASSSGGHGSGHPHAGQTIDVGDDTDHNAVVISADGRHAFVGTERDDRGVIAVIDTSTNRAIKQIAAVESRNLALSPDGRQLWSVSEKDGITVVDTNSYDVVKTFDRIYSHLLTIAFSPDSSKAYLGARGGDGSGAVLVVNTRTFDVDAPLAIGGSPNDLAVSPDGKHLYTANEEDGGGSTNSISIVTTANSNISDPIPTDGEVTSVAVAPDGKHVFALVHGRSEGDSGADVHNSLNIVATDQAQIVDNVDFSGDDPFLAMSPDGARIYLTSSDYSGSPSTGVMRVVGTQTNNVISSVPLKNAGFVRFSSDGALGYIWSEESVTAFEVESSKLLGPPVAVPGSELRGVAVTPDGRRAYVARKDGSVLIMSL